MMSPVDTGPSSSLIISLPSFSPSVHLPSLLFLLPSPLPLSQGGGDYTALPNELTFTSNQTTGTVSITAPEDDEVEGEEQFMISLTTTSPGVLLDPANVNFTIRDRTSEQSAVVQMCIVYCVL